jgi:hypothetical protein
MNSHRVYTRDVDGSTSHRYKSVAGAVKRFESMSGYAIDAAIREHFYATDCPPTLESLVTAGGHVKAVSMYGCVVEIDFAKGAA